MNEIDPGKRVQFADPHSWHVIIIARVGAAAPCRTDTPMGATYPRVHVSVPAHAAVAPCYHAHHFAVQSTAMGVQGNSNMFADGQRAQSAGAASPQWLHSSSMCAICAICAIDMRSTDPVERDRI